MNNPEKNSRGFFEFEGLPAYHTGDVSSMTDEGLLLYGGRMDFKLRNATASSWRMFHKILINQNTLIQQWLCSRYNKDHKQYKIFGLCYLLKDGVAERLSVRLIL